MVSYVFKRYELKYLLTRAQCEAVKSEISSRLSPDVFGKNTVQSLYLDTDDFRLVRESIEKPVFKEKLRLRCYNLNNCDKDIFIEMKRKYDGVVYKRRISCKENEVNEVLNENPQTSQIGKELDYFMRFYGTLSPKMLILYDREAFFDKESDLRVTFDENIRYRTDDLNFYTSLDGEELLSSDGVLMEIKTGSAIPLWLCKILDKEKIIKQSFSKYGTECQPRIIRTSVLRRVFRLILCSATAIYGCIMPFARRVLA